MPAGAAARGRRRRRRDVRTRADVRTLLHRPPDLRDGPVDRHRHHRPGGAARRCRSRSTPRSRRRRCRSRRSTPAPAPRSSPTPSPRRSSRRSTASRTCSTCSRSAPTTASCYLDVTFKLGTNLDIAQVLTQNRVAIAEAKLPEEVKRQGVTTKKKSPIDPAVRQPDLARRQPLRPALPQQLRHDPGEGRAGPPRPASATSRFLGARDYSMRVWLDPEKLAVAQHDAPATC